VPLSQLFWFLLCIAIGGSWVGGYLVLSYMRDYKVPKVYNLVGSKATFSSYWPAVSLLLVSQFSLE
jgi:hypothetical protein